VSSAHQKLGFQGGASVQVGREFGAAARVGETADNPRRHHSIDRRRVLSGALRIRHQPHIRSRQTNR